MSKFVLLASRRSGTTLLIDCLNSHPQVNCVKRAFGLEQKIKNPTPDHQAGGFYIYRMKGLRNRLRFYVNRYELIKDFLADDIFEPHSSFRAAGFRLIYEMSEKYPEIASWVKRNDAKVLHLIRKNLLKTYVSAVSAAIHKMRHPREGAKIKTVKIHIDPDKAFAELNQRSRQIERQRRLFSVVDCHELYYEDFVDNRDEEAVKILEYLGVDASIELTSDLVKINPVALEDVIENYDDVCRKLKGTPYEEFLD